MFVLFIDNTLNTLPVFILRNNFLIVLINWSRLVFLSYFNSWTLYSFLILWSMIRNLNNLWFFSKSASIFFSISNRSLYLLLRNLLNKLRNLRFDYNPWKSGLNIRICVRWSKSFENSEFGLLLGILWLLRWNWFIIDGLSLDISWRCNWRKTLRLSLVWRLSNILLRIRWREQSLRRVLLLLGSWSWILESLLTHFLWKLRVLIILILIIISLQFVRLLIILNLFWKRYAIQFLCITYLIKVYLIHIFQVISMSIIFISISHRL